SDPSEHRVAPMSNRLHERLMQRLRTLGVEERMLPGRDDGFSALVCDGKEVGHFHHAHELDLRLGRAAIEREGLVRPHDSTVHPNRSKNSAWIELRLSNASDVDAIVRLVGLAIEKL